MNFETRMATSCVRLVRKQQAWRRHRNRTDSPARSRARRPLHGLQARKGRDQHEQRRARQMEIGHQHIDGAEAIARRDEDIGLAGERRDLPSRLPRFPEAAATSCRRQRSARRSARAALSASAVVRRYRPHSACILCPAVSSALTGRNVPAPTCRVTDPWRIVALAQRRHQIAGVKCSPAVGAATAPS